MYGNIHQVTRHRDLNFPTVLEGRKQRTRKQRYGQFNADYSTSIFLKSRLGTIAMFIITKFPESFFERLMSLSTLLELSNSEEISGPSMRNMSSKPGMMG